MSILFIDLFHFLCLLLEFHSNSLHGCTRCNTSSFWLGSWTSTGEIVQQETRWSRSAATAVRWPAQGGRKEEEETWCWGCLALLQEATEAPEPRTSPCEIGSFSFKILKCAVLAPQLHDSHWLDISYQRANTKSQSEELPLQNCRTSATFCEDCNPLLSLSAVGNHTILNYCSEANCAAIILYIYLG